MTRHPEPGANGDEGKQLKMSRILKSAAVMLALAGGLIVSTASASAHPLRIETLSSKANWVTGGDALVAVDAETSVKPSKVVIRLDGRVITNSFHVDPGNPQRLIGEVTGIPSGRSVISAWAAGLNSPANLAIFNSAQEGPVFSGPHQTPYFCTTQNFDLGPATDANCSAPTQVSYRYRTTGGNFAVLANPTDRPADMAQTTTRDGQTVDYVVRLESGVINRGVYRFAVLAANGQTGNGWNGRFFYKYGGGCSTGHQQGQSVPNPLDDDELSRGYAVMSSSLNVLNTSCNDVLSAESTSMVKEHAIETLGKAPVWTAGEGGSGGSVQIQMISQNYPGLLDGVLPSASFPDNSSPDYPDCRLLSAYFATPAGSALTSDERMAIIGMAGPNNCAGLAAGADVVNASEGCVEEVVPPSVIFNAVTNPGGVRCTLWDNMINIYGTDPDTGNARRTYDNTGVQYGLGALQDGDITLAQFIDLNQAIGGYDVNGALSPDRTVANEDGLDIAYRSGRLNQGVTTVPIVDARNYVDDDGPNVHQYINTYRTRARLDRFYGSHANQVMFRAKGGQSTTQMNLTALDTLGTWLDNLKADKSDAPLAQKVISSKPADAVDACWIGGVRTNGVAQIGADNICETTYAPHSLPQNVAGRPLDSIVSKCQLKPVDTSDYPGASPGQLNQIRAIFAGGVCDWSKTGVGEQAITGPNQSFGPAQPVTWRNRQLNLRSNRYRVNRSRRGGQVRLTARLRPCPAVIWQRVTFERRVRQGRKFTWRQIGAPIVTGSSCQSGVTVRNIRGNTRLRARARSITGFRASETRVITIKLKARRNRR